MNSRGTTQKLPEFLKPLFWSYNFNSLNLDKNKKTIILTVINYGDLNQWRWLKDYYSERVIKKILESVPATELKLRTGKLAEILFKAKLNHAPRGTH